MSLDDWVSQGSNWQHRAVIRYPASPTAPIIIDEKYAGVLRHTNPSQRGRKITTDTNHGFSTQKALYDGKPFDGDRGGSFFSQTSVVVSPFGEVQQHCFGEGVVPGQQWMSNKYDGPIFAIDPRTVSIPTNALFQNLASKGTTAIARCKPTNNVANLAVSIAEIAHGGRREFLGSAQWKGRLKAAKVGSSGFLLSSFGWEPLVADIRSASYAAANSHRLLESYEKNSGKLVRRRYEFPVEKTEVTEYVGSSDGFSFAASMTNLLDTSKPMPVLAKTTKTYRRTWFSGAFTYHLPVGYNSRNRLIEAAAKAGPLLGIELTPEVVWNAVPWTWAIDWMSNAGDVVSNLSDWSTDGLVLKYGYIMEHTVSEVTYTLTGRCRYKPYGNTFAAPVTAYLETKRRERATPFGFEVAWNGLSPRQLAISAALGITRVF